VLVMIFNRASDLIPSLERKAYDLGVRATSRAPAKNITIIAVDDESLEKIARWPWSRDVLAKMTDQLAAAKAKVIANTILLSEPQVDPGYQYIVKLLDLAQKAAQPGAPADPSASPAAAWPPEGFAPILALLKDAESTLNTDRKLAESYAKAGNVVQPMLFVLGEPRGRPDKPLPPFAGNNTTRERKVGTKKRWPRFAVKNAIATPKGSGESFGFLTSAVRLPIEPVGTVAAGLGHLNTITDVDCGGAQAPRVVR